jgi:nucleotide-binding universal stress UspA family protein
MLEVRRILVPCDFSECSGQALRRAATLAAWYKASITLLHAVPLWPTTLEFPPYVNPLTLESATRDQLLAELEAFAAPIFDPPLEVQLLVRGGSPVTEILAATQETAADLVVMGTHGRRGFRGWALGSVTERVLRAVPCPVLTVHPDGDAPISAHQAPFQRILCAIDFARPSRAALHYALGLAQEGDARLTLVHVMDDDLPPPPFNTPEHRRYVENAVREQLEKVVPVSARGWCHFEEVVRAGEPHTEILRLAHERDVQLIVLGVHGASALAAALFGSTARHVVREAPCPVLTVRSARARAGSAVKRAAGRTKPLKESSLVPC